MSSNDKYTDHLINQAKQGRKNQFIELSLNFFPRIYSIVFGLVPNVEAAKKVCSEVFYIAWKRINTVKSDSDFALQLREIAIVRSFIYLQNVEEVELDGQAIENITKGDPEFFTQIEREFLKLTYKQRVILILNDKLELPTIRIAEVLKTLNQEEIMEELHSARETLLIKFPDGKLADFPEHGWAILNDCLMKLDKGIDQYLEDEVVEFISEYLQQSKSLLDGIFSKITPNDEIIDYLKDYLLKDSSNQKSKKDLDSFSNNYTSVSTNSEDVLFEKAFITPKTTMSDVKENIATIIPAKKNKFWAAILVVFISIFLLAYFYFNISDNSWNVKKGNGIFLVNGNQNQIAELKDGAKISTNNNSKVEILNNNNSNIIILENSNLKLDRIENNFTKFSLLEGSVIVNNIINKKKETTSEEKLIEIKVNGIEVISQEGLLNISFSKETGLEVNVVNGYAEIRFNKIVFSLTKNYRFIKERNNKYSIPFNINSKQKLIELVTNINQHIIDSRMVHEVIQISTQNDYFTLFNLLLICDVSSRKLILNKLNVFFPIKLFFDWDKLVKLEKNEIQFLKDELLLE